MSGITERQFLRSSANNNTQPMRTTKVNIESKHILEETLSAENRERKINTAHCNRKVIVKYPEYTKKGS